MANRIRGYTNKVHLRGLIQNHGFLTHVRPWRSAGKVGFACVDKPVRWAAPPTCSRSVSPWEKHLARGL
ncbi:MAG: hypothetical protein HWQ38_37490 [Nostoc sp. NMS7]|uniref:hypothetical protein n=1 Tax=Nostoc sp. NMS7 TaxID=2815391 RepID=UPI0025D3D900|nr:hypothetical protein [Nostoc sp. NMS7]MBN3951855.1 hypothetical protein [Nostoc sp. NMS7]